VLSSCEVKLFYGLLQLFDLDSSKKKYSSKTTQQESYLLRPTCTRKKIHENLFKLVVPADSIYPSHLTDNCVLCGDATRECPGGKIETREFKLIYANSESFSYSNLILSAFSFLGFFMTLVGRDEN
jgi:ferredoxin